MSQQRYKIGQVLYVVLNKKNVVMPLLVVKELLERTIEGEAVTYMVRGGQDANTTISMADVDGEVFLTAASAKKSLTERATASINKLVDAAVLRAREWYPGASEMPSVDDALHLVAKQAGPQRPAPPVDPRDVGLGIDSSFIELPDGTMARVNSVKLPSAMGGNG